MPRQTPPSIPQPLVVRIEEPTPSTPSQIQRRLRKAVAIVLIGLAILMMAGALVILPTQTLSASAALPVPAGSGSSIPISSTVQLTATLDLPQWSTLRDPLPVHVSLYNGSSQTITATLTLALNPAGFVTLNQDGASSAIFKALPPGGVFTHVFILLPLGRPASGDLGLSLLVTDTDGRSLGRIDQTGWRVKVWAAPPRLRAVLQWLLAGSGLLSAAMALFWERLKKALGYV